MQRLQTQCGVKNDYDKYCQIYRVQSLIEKCRERERERERDRTFLLSSCYGCHANTRGERNSRKLRDGRT